MTKDYYSILGVDKQASKDDIKKAYKTLAKKYHPDVNQQDSSAEAKFKEVNEAAKVLLDDQKRAQYDRFGTADTGPSNQGGYSSSGYDPFSGFGMDDIFESFFGGSAQSSGRTKQHRGNDLLYTISITLEEAAFGAEKTITVNKPSSCKSCHAKGYVKESDATVCHTCHGTGRMTVTQRTPFGVFQSTASCKSCNGVGVQIHTPCSDCSGEGVIEQKKTLNITIPPGIEDSTRLRIHGEGESIRGATSGDLFVQVAIKEHDIFTRDASDIYCTQPISYAIATIGGEVIVPTLKGKAKLTIPAGTSPGTKFALRGKGLPNMGSFGQGDQYVEVTIEIPTKVSKKAKELIQKLDEELTKKKTVVDHIKDVFE
jgi:molecular chaperone DnaJ